MVIWQATVQAASPGDDSLGRGLSAYRSGDYARSFPLLTQAAEAGSAEAAQLIGDIYRNGEGVAPSASAALYWYQRAATAGNVEAQFRLAIAYRDGLGVQRSDQEAVRWASMASARGHTQAQEFVAEAYWFGHGVEVDDAKAIELYRSLAAQGNVVAYERLGASYTYGYGTPIDYGEAVRYYEMAAQRGSASAAASVGNLYETRVKGAPKWAEAMRWYQRAADQRNADGCLQLGRIYATGEGGIKDSRRARELLNCAVAGGLVREAAFRLALLAIEAQPGAPDYKEAFRQFSLCAEEKDSSCLTNLGWMYLYGNGVAKDYRVARRYFDAAWEQHGAYAAMLIGTMFEEGYGVLQDFEEAVRWYRRSAALGDTAGQKHLALAYETGTGVDVDLVEAHKWVNIAATSESDEKARGMLLRARDRLVAKMSKAQVVEAQRAARAWKPLSADELDAQERAEEVVVEAADAEAPSAAEAPTKASLAGSGSGFWISATGHALTAKHVVAECQEIRVIDGGVDLGRAAVVAQDPQEDLAVIQSKTASRVFGAIRPGAIRQGEEVVAYGFPLGGALSVSGVSTSGTVSALAGLGNSPASLQFSAPVQPGNSGGPLMDVFGNVIGVVVSKLNAMRVAKAIGDVPQNVNFAVKSSVAINLMDAFSVPYSTQVSQQKLGSAEATERARSITVRIDCYR